MAMAAFLRLDNKTAEDQYFRVLCYVYSRLIKITDRDTKEHQTPQQIRKLFSLSNGKVDIDGLLEDFQIMLDQGDKLVDAKHENKLDDMLDDSIIYSKIEYNNAQTKFMQQDIEAMGRNIAKIKKTMSNIDGGIVAIANNTKKYKIKNSDCVDGSVFLIIGIILFVVWLYPILMELY